MTQAYLLINTRLDQLHYDALTTMGALNLIKSPVTLRQPWKKIDEGPLSDDNLTLLIDWLKANAHKNDFLVIEGDEANIQSVLQEARKIGLIAMRPVWQPAPAFIPLISED